LEPIKISVTNDSGEAVTGFQG